MSQQCQDILLRVWERLKRLWPWRRRRPVAFIPRHILEALEVQATKWRRLPAVGLRRFGGLPEDTAPENVGFFQLHDRATGESSGEPCPGQPGDSPPRAPTL